MAGNLNIANFKNNRKPAQDDFGFAQSPLPMAGNLNDKFKNNRKPPQGD
jgi:hypothetical protein